MIICLLPRYKRMSNWIPYPFPLLQDFSWTAFQFPPKSDWAHLLSTVNTNINNGVVASTHKVEALLAALAIISSCWYWPVPSRLGSFRKNPCHSGFCYWVRGRSFRHGKQVKVDSIQTAIGAIAKVIKLAGFANPLHRTGTTNYHAAIALQTESYHQTNPTPIKQMAVLVKIPNFIYENTRKAEDCRVQAIGELTLIAFYFLLHVGEYTHHGKGIWWTQQFQICNMKFFANGKEIKPQMLPNHAKFLTINNQKNGNCGQTLSHHALKTGNKCCPVVHALVSWTIALVWNRATPKTLICTFRDSKSLAWQHVRSQDIVKAVQDAIKILGTDDDSFNIAQVGLHSLWAGEAMALYITKHSTIKIQCAGRWTSTTFMECIYGQLDIISKCLSQLMSKSSTLFVNMAQ